MSHNINYNEQKGVHSFFSVKEKPWHGLGKIVDDYPTSKQAMAFAGLDFTVQKRQLFTYDNLNNVANAFTEIKTAEIEVPDFFATVRTDTEEVLGVVGRDYEVVQNADAFCFFDAIVGGDGIMYETAGALGKGERVFITAKLPGYINVGSNDLIEKYLFLTTSHNGYGSITAAFTPIRIVCNNTLNAALRNQTNSVKIRHTANAKERLEQAHVLMGITNELSNEIESIFKSWSKISITDNEIKKLIQLALVPNKEVYRNIQMGKDDELSTCFKNICDSAFAYAAGDDAQQTETTKGTLFGAYNAVTGYFQNVRNYKNDEAKLKSILMGGTAQLRSQKAFDLCMLFSKNDVSSFNVN